MEQIILKLAISMPGFLVAIVIHEYAHGWMALKFGDYTAKDAGRLTLNPIAHMDLFGTVIFPILGLIFGFWMFGWARPVPVDSRYFKSFRKGIFWVSFAGPLANIILGTLCSFLVAILVTKVSSDFYFYSPFLEMLKYSVMINFILAVFNLIPLPPLDGSKMVMSFMEWDTLRKYQSLEAYSFFILLFLMMTNVLSYVLRPAVMLGQTLMIFFANLLT